MRPLPPLLIVFAATSTACHAEPKPKAPDPAWAGFEPERASRDGEEAAGGEDAKREAERELPLEIPVDPRRGPPPSYVEVVSPNWGQAGVGLFVFGVSYAPLAFASSHLGGNAWTMQVPIVGPSRFCGSDGHPNVTTKVSPSRWIFVRGGGSKPPSR